MSLARTARRRGNSACLDKHRKPIPSARWTVRASAIERFRDAFAARPTPPRNALLQRLREAFELELFARFGFLAEAFVRGPIAGCFDPQQARNRRFVEQIADVDERRLESGSGSALYLVSRVDPAEAR